MNKKVTIYEVAKKAGVEKVDLGEKALMISFKEGVKINMPAIVDFIGNSASKIKIRSDNKLLVFIEDKRGDKILKNRIKNCAQITHKKHCEIRNFQALDYFLGTALRLCYFCLINHIIYGYFTVFKRNRHILDLCDCAHSSGFG